MAEPTLATPSFLRQRAWLPVPLFLVAMVGLWVADLQVLWAAQPLYWFLHYGFALLGFSAIVVPAARSFLSNGQLGVLFVSCGMLILSVGTGVAANAATWSLDASVAIYNTSALLSGVCHVASIAVASRRVNAQGRAAGWLTIVLTGGIAAAGLVIWLVLSGRAPTFFVDGRGGTTANTLVVGSAVILFLMAAVRLWQADRRETQSFLHWYSPGLVLLAAGLAGSTLVELGESPLQWATRSTQFAGVAYLCLAALLSANERGSEGISMASVEGLWRLDSLLASIGRRLRRRWALRYGQALGAVAAAMALRWLLEAWIGSALPTYFTFYPAMLLAALLGGVGPGLLATVSMSAFAVYWLLPPVGHVAIASPVDRLGLVIFLGMGLVASATAELFRRNQAKAAAYDRERALREIWREKEFLAELLDHSAQPFAVEYPDRRLGRINDAFERLTGYSGAELRDLDLAASLTPPEWRELEAQRLAELERSGLPVRYEKEIVRKDGARVPVELLVHLQRDEAGRPEYYYSFIADITERKRAEERLRHARAEAEAASLAKSRFLAAMSHELRTPMNAILGMTDLALQDELAPQLHDMLQTTRDSAASLLQLLAEILDILRLEAGRLQLEQVEFSLRAVLSRTLEPLAPLAFQRRLELVRHVQPETPDALIGDPHRLGQVLTNLVANAIASTSAGEVVVEVGLAERSEHHATLELSVSDTGPGIAPEDLERLFEPFARVGDLTPRERTGAGLGLAISRGLIELMGGRLEVRSSPGVGSTFRFTARLELQPDRVAAEAARAMRDQLAGARALVVEENATSRASLEQILARWGMQVEGVADAPMALARLHQALAEDRPFRVVLASLRLPRFEGDTLARWIAKQPHLAERVVLLVPPTERAEGARRCEEVGALYVEKPVVQSELLSALAAALGGAPPQRAEQVEPDAEAAMSGLGRPLRVLVAEDTPANQKLARLVLERRGHVVEIAENGREALDLLRRHDFRADAVLMDVQMPEMDGFQATAEIRTLDDPEKAKLPIIAMTAHALEGDRERCLEAGMDAYLSKPIDGHELIRLVERLGGHGGQA